MRLFCDAVSTIVSFRRALSARSLSKIAHVYKLIVIGIVGNQARTIEVSAQTDIDAAFQVLRSARRGTLSRLGG